MSDTTLAKIEAEIGPFVLVSSSGFQPFDGITRTRITVRKPKGKKLIHLIRYENGSVRRVL